MAALHGIEICPESIADLRIPARTVVSADIVRPWVLEAITATKRSASAAEIVRDMCLNDGESQYHCARFSEAGDQFIGLIHRKLPFACEHGLFLCHGGPGQEPQLNCFAVTDRKQYQWNFEIGDIPCERRERPILDLSCGRGGRVLEMRRDGMNAIGVDPAIIESALPPELAGVLRCGVTAQLPFGDGAVSRVESYYGFFMVEKTPARILAGLREVSRVLESGGMLMIVPPSRYLLDNIYALLDQVPALHATTDPGWRIVLRKK